MAGGYEYDAVEDVKQDFYCVICLNLMKDAMQLECGHGMCNFCLQKLEKSSKDRNVDFICPSCRENIVMDNVHPAMMINRIISSVKVKCSNTNKGCEWIGEVGNTKDHEKTCNYEEVECSFQHCVVKLQRSNIQQHEKECMFRRVLCDYCSEECIYNNVGNHLKKCGHFPILCKNECGEMVQRRMMLNHFDECKLQETDCIYVDIGCQIKILKKDLDDHNQEFFKEHLHLCVADLKETKLQLKKATTNGCQNAAILDTEYMSSAKNVLVEPVIEFIQNEYSKFLQCLYKGKDNAIGKIAKADDDMHDMHSQVRFKEILFSELYQLVSGFENKMFIVDFIDSLTMHDANIKLHECFSKDWFMKVKTDVLTLAFQEHSLKRFSLIQKVKSMSCNRSCAILYSLLNKKIANIRYEIYSTREGQKYQIACDGKETKFVNQRKPAYLLNFVNDEHELLEIRTIKNRLFCCGVINKTIEELYHLGFIKDDLLLVKLS